MKRLLCIGDSNTYGYDPRSLIGGRFPESVRWTGRLKASGYDVLNYGQNGACIPNRSDLVIDLIKRNLPLDRVVIMLGSNDLLEGRSAEETAVRMEQLLWNLHLGTDVHILLVCPPPMKRGEWVETDQLVSESKQLGSLYRKAAQLRDTQFADAADWNIDLLFDGVHFSEEGHRAFAQGITAVL